MAEVTVYSKEHIDGILNEAVTSAAITDGHLILTLGDGTTVDVGAVVSAVPDATDTSKGVVELATDTETIAGTDGFRAVTPLGLSGLTSTDTRKGMVELATAAEVATGTDTTRAVTAAGVKAAYQPLDQDLTDIANITGKLVGDFINYQSGGWVRRTPAQSATTLSAVGMPLSYYSTGSGYITVNTPAIYVGPTDPGTVASGSLWFDTTGT